MWTTYLGSNRIVTENFSVDVFSRVFLENTFPFDSGSTSFLKPTAGCPVQSHRKMSGGASPRTDGLTVQSEVDLSRPNTVRKTVSVKIQWSWSVNLIVSDLL